MIKATEKIYKVKNYYTASLFFNNNQTLPNECKYMNGVPLRKDRVNSNLALRYDPEDDLYAVVVNDKAIIGYYGKKDYYKIVVPKRCENEGTPEQLALFLPDGIHARYVGLVASLVDKLVGEAFSYENQARTIRFQDGKWCINVRLREEDVRAMAAEEKTAVLFKKVLSKTATTFAEERREARIAALEFAMNEINLAIRKIKLNKELKRSEREHLDRVLRKSMSGYKEPKENKMSDKPSITMLDEFGKASQQVQEATASILRETCERLNKEHSEPAPPPPLPKARTAPLNKICLVKQHYGGEPIDISMHKSRVEALLALREHKSKDPEARYFLIKK